MCCGTISIQIVSLDVIEDLHVCARPVGPQRGGHVADVATRRDHALRHRQMVNGVPPTRHRAARREDVVQRVSPHRRRAGVPLVTLPAQLLLVLAVGALPRPEARQHRRRHRIVDTGAGYPPLGLSSTQLLVELSGLAMLSGLRRMRLPHRR